MQPYIIYYFSHINGLHFKYRLCSDTGISTRLKNLSLCGGTGRRTGL